MMKRELGHTQVQHRAVAGFATSVILAASIATLSIAPAAFASDEAPSWFERIDFSGDFRGRDEVFVFDGMKDRHRLRYRLRFGAKTEVNDHVELGLRLATGPDANSGNQTLGSGVDFEPDGIFLDKAYITVKPHGAEKPTFGDSFDVTFGKMGNPFRPRKGMGEGLLIWDGDITPEGVALSWGASPCDCWTTNLDVAYFVIDENSGTSDPFEKRDPAIIAVQLDDTVKITDDIKFQSHLSYYALRKLDGAFADRVAGGDGEGFNGNTAGLTSNRHVDLLEFHGATSVGAIEDWPLTVWGSFIINLSADGVGEGKQNKGFGVGVEVGDKKKFVKIGAAYFEIEADAVPANLHDSDVLDGTSNGKSWLIAATRQIWTNTDFHVRAYFSDELDKDVSALQDKSPTDRVRVQTNVVVKF